MALSPAKKEKLKALELKRGGVAFVSERSSATPTPTVIISLGGLGGKTLNTLKGKFEREIGKSDHVYFRMLDTAREDCEKLWKVKRDGTLNDNSNANLEAGETIPLYDPAISGILMPATLPPYMKKWINTSLIGTRLDDTGAQQIRQLGRAMLANDVVYSSVRANLEAVLQSAISQKGINGSVDVILIAGVSGGTGSGTIVDIAYMLHDIFNSNGCVDYRVSGYIYTPDAQFLEEGIAGNDSIILNLKKNGYAALKEIDYFMNIEETNSIYNLRLGTRQVVSSNNIFSSCTLISGYAEQGGLKELELTMGRVTDQLMDMLTDISIVKHGMPVQLSSSLLSNESAMLKAFLATHPDRKRYHRYASYKYQVLGYSSIVIPRDEILAYCVNKIYQRVLEEFKSFSLVNKEMLKDVANVANVSGPDVFTQYATTINPNNPIVRTLVLDSGYTRKMIKENNMIAYQDACEIARSEKLKINAGYQAVLEASLFDVLKKQVDLIFDKYGPYVALKVIEHKHTELSVGNPNEPFPGIVELLEMLSKKFLEKANAANNAYNQGGAQELRLAADNACSGIFSNHTAISEYVNVCCEMAVTTQIDPVLFKTFSDVLHNVAVKMNELNNELFDVYTSILTEIQNLLNNDGQYFTQGVMSEEGNHRTFSVDIIKSGAQQTERLRKYLDNFISGVAVDALTLNFIKTMKKSKEKWLAQNNENDFDVVSEVRALMDECLTNSRMKDDIIEKFVTVAYNPTDITADELEQIWNDNSPNGPKMQALTRAANEIFTILQNGKQTMANTRGRIHFSDFTTTGFVSVLNETPQLTAILNNIIQTSTGFEPARSRSNNKFIMTQQYVSIPMYMLRGMDDFNRVYVEHPTAGRHMDEIEQNWGRFPNPYTIDSVALDLNDAGRPVTDIESYPDHVILKDVEQKVKDALYKYGFAKIIKDGTGLSKMFFYDITTKPSDMDAFKKNLSDAMVKNDDLDVIEFMKKNGFILNPVEINMGNSDVDVSLVSFEDASFEDMELKYKEVPVMVPDICKWVRKSIKYMDILDKSTHVFEEIQDAIEVAMVTKTAKQRYKKNVEIFAFALRTGLIKQDEANTKVWKFMNGTEPVNVNFGRAKSFDKEFFLYHLFVKFNEIEDKRLASIKAQAERMIDDGKEVDYSAISQHVANSLSDSALGYSFNEDKINEKAEEQGVTENYIVTDRPDDEKNPYKILGRFYRLLKTSLE